MHLTDPGRPTRDDRIENGETVLLVEDAVVRPLHWPPEQTYTTVKIESGTPAYALVNDHRYRRDTGVGKTLEDPGWLTRSSAATLQEIRRIRILVERLRTALWDPKIIPALGLIAQAIDAPSSPVPAWLTDERRRELVLTLQGQITSTDLHVEQLQFMHEFLELPDLGTQLTVGDNPQVYVVIYYQLTPWERKAALAWVDKPTDTKLFIKLADLPEVKIVKRPS